MDIELSSWATFKSTCITAKSLNCQYKDAGDSYTMLGPDSNGILWLYTMPKDSGADQTDFETNFKSTFNGRIGAQLDSDGAPMSRVKVAPSGWNFNLRGIEFTTSTIASLVNKDATNADLSDATLKLYDVNGAIITDPTLALANCVKSVLDVEPPYDIYVAGGHVRLLSAPSSDARLAVIGVPDVPAQYGGSKGFVQNINLRYIPISEGVNADGRAAKWLQYSATYHTNKLRFICYHDAGVVIPMMVMLETYKL